MKKQILYVLGISCSQYFFGQVSVSEKNQDNWLTAKNYYFSYLVSENQNLVYELQSDKNFKNLWLKRNQRLMESKNCKTVECFLEAFKWNQEEITKIPEIISNHFESSKPLQDLVKNKILPSKTYSLKENKNLKEFVKQIAAQDFGSMNYAIDVYAGGKKPNYPKIDSISFDVKDKQYPALLNSLRQEIFSENNFQKNLFPTMPIVARILEINERADAGMMMLLQQKENQKAYDKVEVTDFKKYPYSAILTLGAGPEIPNQKISPMGMLRARTAANHYFKGIAPFVIVSGGRVHPYKTPFVEALEMKKYLMKTLSVPEEAIIIEPLARHTTTNYRNAIRIMLESGFPKDKMAVSTSSAEHLDAVEKMDERNRRELGFSPYKLGKRTAETLLEFLPLDSAFVIDADEPMDP